MMGDGKAGARPRKNKLPTNRPIEGAPLGQLRQRFCVFCGQDPSAKTVEHIIPQWLIGMTGNPRRTARLSRAKDGLLIERPFNSFKFPACDECNSRFSRLEGRVSRHFQLLAAGDPIAEAAVVDLLDWFDKVRVGLWLGGIVLDNVNGIAPTFQISQRVGYADRVLAVWRTNRQRTYLGWLGAESWLFRHMPIAFGLAVNDLVFLNLSTLGLCGAALGTPHITTARSVGCYDPRMNVHAEEGTGRLVYPVLSKWNEELNGLEFYQGILREDTILGHGAVRDAFPQDVTFETRGAMVLSSVFVRSGRDPLAPINTRTEVKVPEGVLESARLVEWCEGYAASVQFEQFELQTSDEEGNSDQSTQIAKTKEILHEELQLILGTNGGGSERY